MALFSSALTFTWSANADGLAIRFSNSKHYAKAKLGKADEAFQIGFIRMQMLAECGQADVREVDAGIFIVAADAVRLDRETREGFMLPPVWPGGMRLQTDSVPQTTGFRVRLGLVDPGTGVQWEWKLRGPILEIGASSYLPTAAQYAALLAIQTWTETDHRSELANLSMLATLREAREAGCHIDLEAYRETTVSNALELRVHVSPDTTSGDLVLVPLLSGNFPDIDAEEIQQRSAQLSAPSTRAVIRVGKTIILLDPTQTLQARALVARGRVPQAQIEVFRKDPASWMAEHVFPDVETEFSPRVTGIGFWKSAYAGSMWEEGEDWFGKKPQPEKSPAGDTSGAEGDESSSGANTGEENSPVVAQIFSNDTDLSFGWREAEMEATELALDFSRYARAPMEHQTKAVYWLLRHARRALRRRDSGGEVPGLGAGALLADDMGLGKTFSTLIFLREWFDLWRKTVGDEPPAVLIVAPLSLLENWKSEIVKSYGESSSVFRRVLIAQSDGDLNAFRRRPNSRDRAVPEAIVEYGLCFGDDTERSLDLPRSCVLTTYQTLRDYRFSFAKAKWSAAVFDEAQNIKNPNAMQTIAAKSLNALFRLTLTGTPVENHLGDFWSILDTSEPGPLGSFAEFRTNWITPMARDNERMGEIGLRLREHVGDLMLRRMKEEELTGLPEKNGHKESISVELTAEQLRAYDVIVDSVQGGDLVMDGGPSRQNRQLAALWQLRQVSLHPDLLAGGDLGKASNSRDSRVVLQRSGKLAWLLQRLDQIKLLNEKVLIFCVQKKLQEGLSRHISLIYGINVP
ncbi:MAG: SNF2-related protein, partial [Chthoniobacteraceae bacterium]|nr:SNF2-related protein [Chthoniobacteraceae bacterium]